MDRNKTTLKRFWLGETVDLDTLKKFVSMTSSDGVVLSHRNTPLHADRWTLVRARNTSHARELLARGETVTGWNSF